MKVFLDDGGSARPLMSRAKDRPRIESGRAALGEPAQAAKTILLYSSLTRRRRNRGSNGGRDRCPLPVGRSCRQNVLRKDNRRSRGGADQHPSINIWSIIAPPNWRLGMDDRFARKGVSRDCEGELKLRGKGRGRGGVWSDLPFGEAEGSGKKGKKVEGSQQGCSPSSTRWKVPNMIRLRG